MKYVRACFLGLGVWAISFPLFMAISFAVNSLLYPALLEWFPGFLPQYNFVNERESYERFFAFLDLLSGILAIFVSSYITIRLDNERMEYMITKTQGMYTIKEGASIYFSEYVRADLAAALAIPLPLLLVDVFIFPQLAFLPDGVLSIIEMLFSPTRAFTDFLGIILSYFVMAAMMFFARCLSAYRAIDVWRVIWLSDIEYVG